MRSQRVGIPAPLVAALRQHRETQQVERQTARQFWEEGDWVFSEPNRRPINPRADHDAWKALLEEARVRPDPH